MVERFNSIPSPSTGRFLIRLAAASLLRVTTDKVNSPCYFYYYVTAIYIFIKQLFSITTITNSWSCTGLAGEPATLLCFYGRMGYGIMVPVSLGSSTACQLCVKPLSECAELVVAGLLLTSKDFWVVCF